MTKAEIQFVRSLSDKRTRDEHGVFIAEGDKLIGEILSSHLKIHKIYALAGHLEPHAEIVSEKEMERISQLKSASSSLAIVEQPRHTTPHTAPSNTGSFIIFQ